MALDLTLSFSLTQTLTKSFNSTSTSFVSNQGLKIYSKTSPSEQNFHNNTYNTKSRPNHINTQT